MLVSFSREGVLLHLGITNPSTFYLLIWKATLREFFCRCGSGRALAFRLPCRSRGSGRSRERQLLLSGACSFGENILGGGETSSCGRLQVKNDITDECRCPFLFPDPSKRSNTISRTHYSHKDENVIAGSVMYWIYLSDLLVHRIILFQGDALQSFECFAASNDF